MGGDISISKIWTRSSFPGRGSMGKTRNSCSTTMALQTRDEILPLARIQPQNTPSPPQTIRAPSLRPLPVLPDVVNCFPHSLHFRGPSAMWIFR